MKKFYVAAPGAIIEEAHSVIQMIHGTGHLVTFDWTWMKEDGGEGEMRDSWRDDRKGGEVHAEKERQAIKRCDIVALLLPGPSNASRGRGCYIEVGMGLAYGKEVWVVGMERFPFDSVFFSLPEVKFVTFAELPDKVRSLEVVK